MVLWLDGGFPVALFKSASLGQANEPDDREVWLASHVDGARLHGVGDYIPSASEIQVSIARAMRFQFRGLKNEMLNDYPDPFNLYTEVWNTL